MLKLTKSLLKYNYYLFCKKIVVNVKQKHVIPNPLQRVKHVIPNPLHRVKYVIPNPL